MRTDIVCYYAELGRPYGPLIELMTQSARRVMPVAKLILLSPTPDCAVGKLFDEVRIVDRPTDFGNLCLERAVATSSWAMQTKPDTATIFVDPDIEFIAPVTVDTGFDIGLMWRKKSDQPVNTGMLLAIGRRDVFWKHYGKVAANLPRDIRHWWCDQLAFSLMTGVCHKTGATLLLDDARVRLLDLDALCPLSDAPPPSTAWAVHHKGRRKGPGWEQIYRSEEEAAA